MESNTYKNLICPLCGGELLWMPVSHIFACERCKNSFSEDAKFYLHKKYMPREKSKGSAPRRNCDVGNVEEQARRYHNFAGRYNPCSYKGHARCAEDCPVHIKLTQEGLGELLCQLEWAQMPYEEGGAK